MDAAAGAASVVAKKSNTWKWVIGVVIVAVVAFLALGRSITNGYEAVVKQRLSNPTGEASFSGVQRYKSGVVCGTVTGSAGRQRFIVGTGGEAFLEDGTLTGAQVFNLTSDKLCRE